jgi:hypothetical protein
MKVLSRRNVVDGEGISRSEVSTVSDVMFAGGGAGI